MKKTYESELVEPDPSALIESLRSFGYSPQTSIADLVDNSVTAGASKIDVHFRWDGQNSIVAIVDNGIGMSEKELKAAMRPGSSNPLSERDESDLGRFGLGLKTASFSQARSLTVSSRKGKARKVSTRRWDLDHVGKTKKWELLLEARSGSQDVIDELAFSGQGTVVLWEELDRVVGGAESDDERAMAHFSSTIKDVEKHLAVVFHRLLERKGEQKLTITVNKNEVKPWDPFLQSFKATQLMEAENLPSQFGSVPVQGFILPHHSRLSKAQHKEAAGIRGWNLQQGFYVYRADRLIIQGDWFLPRIKAEEHYKLARISIDINQKMDGEWDIDVRKSRARPPNALRDDLRRIAKVSRLRASEVYRHRGKRLSNPALMRERVDAWEKKLQKGKIHYVVNRDHAIVKQALEIPAEHQKSVKALLTLLEATIPVPLITMDAYSGEDEIASLSSLTFTRAFEDAARAIITAHLQSGDDIVVAKAKLLMHEPFCDMEAEIDALNVEE